MADQAYATRSDLMEINTAKLHMVRMLTLHYNESCMHYAVIVCRESSLLEGLRQARRHWTTRPLFPAAHASV